MKPPTKLGRVASLTVAIAIAFGVGGCIGVDVDRARDNWGPYDAGHTYCAGDTFTCAGLGQSACTITAGCTWVP